MLYSIYEEKSRGHIFQINKLFCINLIHTLVSGIEKLPTLLILHSCTVHTHWGTVDTKVLY